MKKDLTNFSKLSNERQIEIAKAFIKTLPKEEQEKATKEILGE